MAKTPQQKEAAELWRREQQELEWMAKDRSKAYYLPKYIRDICNTGDVELNALVDEMRKISYKIDEHWSKQA